MRKKKAIQVLVLVFGLSLAGLLARSFAQTTFTDVTKKAGVGHEGSGWGTAFGDYNNDGYIDIYVANNGANVLYCNNGDGTFTEITKEAGVGDIRWSIGAIFGDYDNDGDIDIYVENAGGGNALYRNNGDGTFTDVTDDAGVGHNVTGHAAAFFDYDNDGYLDIYVTIDGPPNILYHNNGDGTFSNATSAAGVGATGTSVGIAFGDYDNDGHLDIYVGNFWKDTDVLYRNNGDGTFTDVTDEAGVTKKLSTGGVAFGDYDNDGHLDIYVGNGDGANVLYRNNGDGTFTDVTDEANVGHTGAADNVAFGDYDNDGYLDIYVVNGTIYAREEVDVLYRNNGDGTFIDVTDEAGIGGEGPGIGVAFGDYNNDGFLDIYVSNGSMLKAANVLYRNNGNMNDWLHIKIVGTKSNKDGIGARVKVVAGALSMIRQVGGDSAYSQNSLPVEFGLGRNTEADLVEIRWPSGIVDTFTNVRANQVIEVTEGASEFVVSVEPQDKDRATWGKMRLPDVGNQLPVDSFRLPTTNSLSQNYPNPFNPDTWIPYQLAEPAEVKIRIYAQSGQLVRKLDLGHKLAGFYLSLDKAAYWDGMNEGGELVSSGIYFYLIEAGDFTATRKMLMVK